VAAGLDVKRVKRNAKLCGELMSRYPESLDLEDALVHLTSELSVWSAFRDADLMSLASSVLRQSGCRKLSDPFGGGGSIPLEAARLGLSVGTGDLNPASVILLRTMLKVLPSASSKVFEAFDAVVERVGKIITSDFAELFPCEGDSEVAALLWAWNLECPSCGDLFPLISNPILSTKSNKSIGLERHDGIWVSRVVTLKNGTVTVSQGSACCPNCATLIDSKSLMALRRAKAMGEKVYAIVLSNSDKSRSYVTNAESIEAIPNVEECDITIPNEFRLPLDGSGIRHLWAMAYGVVSVSDVFSSRQIQTLSAVMRELRNEAAFEAQGLEDNDAAALQVLIALIAVRLSLYNSRHSWWQGKGEFPAQTFVRQALSMVWNYCEISPASTLAGGLESASRWVQSAAKPLTSKPYSETCSVWYGSAEEQPLESESVELIVTDPPYFDSVTYAYLSDVFYPVYRIMLMDSAEWSDLIVSKSSPRDREAIVDRPHKSIVDFKSASHFQDVMTESFAECRRVIRNSGTMVVMYGHKKESAWTSLLQSIADGGFVVTAATELVSERGSKFQHAKVEHLENSVALICSPTKAGRIPMPVTPSQIRSMVDNSYQQK
jgi:adenine-specific DNA methylase